MTEIFIQFLIEASPKDFHSLICHSDIRQDEEICERIYRERVAIYKSVVPDISYLKPVDVTWKEFYGFNLEILSGTGRDVMNHCSNCVYRNRPKELAFFISLGHFPDFNTIPTIVYLGHLDILRPVIQYFKIVSPSCVDIAARNGNLEILKFLYSQGASINAASLEFVISTGYIHILEWLYETSQVRHYSSDWIELAKYYKQKKVRAFMKKCNRTQ